MLYVYPLSYGQVVFVDMAEEWGVNDSDFTAGVGIVDIDSDSRSEIITTAFEGNDRLYKWNGSSYDELGEDYGLAVDADHHHQIALTDIDKDNLPDIFISGDPAYNDDGFLYLNYGHSPFYEGAEGYNLDYVIELGSAFFQFSPTSELAVLCGRRFMVRQGQTFLDITEGSGFETIENVLAPIFLDIDGDNDDDLFVGANWGSEYGRLFRNNGDTTFTDISYNTNEGSFLVGQGVATGDFDGDEDFDLYLTSGTSNNSMWFNDGSGYFTNATEYSNTGVSGFTRGACTGDFDNDGDLDLFVNRAYEYNVLFINNGDGSFFDYSEEGGVIDSYNGAGCATSDLNNDGQLDIVAVNYEYGPKQLLINQTQNDSFLKIKLIGEYPNTLALGTVIKLYGCCDDSSNTEQYIGMREVRSVTTMYSFDDPIIHFGTGNYTNLRAEIVFCSLKAGEISNITPGQTLTIYESSFEDVSINDQPNALPKDHLILNAYPNPFNSTTKIAITGAGNGCQLYIYDILGRLIKSENIQTNGAGVSFCSWNGTSNSGARVASGVYYVKAVSGSYTASTKIILLE